jgi:hypothetical protein
MRLETKDHLLGVFLAVLDGRSPREHVMALDGQECLEGHDVFNQCDALMKAQWRLNGSPEPDTPVGVETGNQLTGGR